MRDASTRSKVAGGFVAALGVAMVVGIASYLASREIGRQLDTVSDSQFPLHRALADVQGGFRQANTHLSNLALARVTHSVMRAEDCRSCHENTSIFSDRSDAALRSVEGAMARVQGLPQTPAVTRLWPGIRTSLDDWLAQSRRLRQLLSERDRLAERSGGADAQLQRAEVLLWEQWRSLHQLADPIAGAVAALEEGLRAEAAASQSAGKVAQQRQLQVEVAVLAFGAGLMILLGFLIGRSVNAAIASLVGQAAKLTDSATRGQLDVRADEAAVPGEFRPVISGMNSTIDAFVAPMRLSSANLMRFSKGELPETITAAACGEFAEVNRNWNELIRTVSMRSADTRRLLAAAREGRLTERADASVYSGYNGQLVDGLNGILDAFSAPLSEARQVLDRLASRDLTARMTGLYPGDYAKVKEAVNSTARAIHDALAQVAGAANQVSAASGEIASASHSVADGASRQASALEQSSASLASISSTTGQAADSGAQADALARTARSAADQGVSAVQLMSGAMSKVRVAAESTSQIIKDINEIAFQTNLLALNAAVEAARAGAAGRGFAVVAEEVRSLALRSKAAANKTEDLIRESLRQADEGDSTAKLVSGRLKEITAAVAKVSDIVAEISASSKEQASGIEQVARAVADVDTVTQQNAANAEQSSSAATELLAQAKALAGLVGSFRIEQAGEASRQGTDSPRPLQRRPVQPRSSV